MRETVYHVFDKIRHEHLYFGSLVAIFSQFTEEEIAITLKQLYRHNFDAEPINNDFVEIDKGYIVRSKQKVVTV